METDPVRMCALLVGLPDVDVLAVDDLPDAPIVIVVESRLDAVWCGQCGVRARVKDRPSQPVRLGEIIPPWPAAGSPPSRLGPIPLNPSRSSIEL